MFLSLLQVDQEVGWFHLFYDPVVVLVPMISCCMVKMMRFCTFLVHSQLKLIELGFFYGQVVFLETQGIQKLEDRGDINLGSYDFMLYGKEVFGDDVTIATSFDLNIHGNRSAPGTLFAESGHVSPQAATMKFEFKS